MAATPWNMRATRPAIRRALAALPAVREVKAEGGRLLVRVASGRDVRPEISRAVTGAGGLVLGITRQEMSLEEAFLTVTDDKVKRLAGETGR